MDAFQRLLERLAASEPAPDAWLLYLLIGVAIVASLGGHTFAKAKLRKMSVLSGLAFLGSLCVLAYMVVYVLAFY